jgi:hypothetical protein
VVSLFSSKHSFHAGVCPVGYVHGLKWGRITWCQLCMRVVLHHSDYSHSCLLVGFITSRCFICPLSGFLVNLDKLPLLFFWTQEKIHLEDVLLDTMPSKTPITNVNDKLLQAMTALGLSVG